MSDGGMILCMILCVLAVIVFVWWIVSLVDSSNDGSSAKGVQSKPMFILGFNGAFRNRLGRDPTQFIEDKLRAGSSPDDVEYEYEIIAAEIERQSGCTAPAFNFYFRPYMMYIRPVEVESPPELLQDEPETPPAPPKSEPAKPSITPAVAPVLVPPKMPEAAICIRELLYKQKFLEMYPQRLWNLAHDKNFMQAINAIQAANKDVELSADRNDPAFKKFKLHILPASFSKASLNLDPDYLTIQSDVVKRGCSKLSAAISVYYALRLYQM